jgi:hypothetical protein
MSIYQILTKTIKNDQKMVKIMKIMKNHENHEKYPKNHQKSIKWHFSYSGHIGGYMKSAQFEVFLGYVIYDPHTPKMGQKRPKMVIFDHFWGFRVYMSMNPIWTVLTLSILYKSSFSGSEIPPKTPQKHPKNGQKRHICTYVKHL